MSSVILSDALLALRPSADSSPSPSKAFSGSALGLKPSVSLCHRRQPLLSRVSVVSPAVARIGAFAANSTPSNAVYTVGDFMTKKQDLHVVKPTTTVDRALEMLVENRITGFPVINEDWTLAVQYFYEVAEVEHLYTGSGRTDTSMFPEADTTWKAFNEIQKLLSKTNGKVIAEVMTPAPLVVRETTNLEDAARLLLETKYRRLPVVDGAGKLVGMITRGNVVRAALHIKRENEKSFKA